MTAVSESDVDAGECQASSLPIIRQSGASSAIDDVTAYVDAADAKPVTHGDVVDLSDDAIQVDVGGICYVIALHYQYVTYVDSAHQVPL